MIDKYKYPEKYNFSNSREERILDVLIQRNRDPITLNRFKKIEPDRGIVIPSKNNLPHRFKINQNFDARSCIGYGLGFECLDEYSNAYKYYCVGLACCPDDPQTKYFLYNNSAYSLNMLQNFIEAEEYCRNAISITDQFFNAYKNLGFSYIGQQRYSDAILPLLIACRKNLTDHRSIKILIRLEEIFPEVSSQYPNLHELILEEIEHHNNL